MNSSELAGGLGSLVGLATSCFFAVLGLAVFVFFIYCYWRICAKAGYSGALSLLNLVPAIGTIIVICILAFGKWKVFPDRQSNN